MLKGLVMLMLELIQNKHKYLNEIRDIINFYYYTIKWDINAKKYLIGNLSNESFTIDNDKYLLVEEDFLFKYCVHATREINKKKELLNHIDYFLDALRAYDIDFIGLKPDDYIDVDALDEIISLSDNCFKHIKNELTSIWKSKEPVQGIVGYKDV